MRTCVSLSVSLFLSLSVKCLVLSRQGDGCRMEAQVRSLIIPSVVMFSRLCLLCRSRARSRFVVDFSILFICFSLSLSLSLSLCVPLFLSPCMSVGLFFCLSVTSSRLPWCHMQSAQLCLLRRGTLVKIICISHKTSLKLEIISVGISLILSLLYSAISPG